jgi:hypothetical protein
MQVEKPKTRYLGRVRIADLVTIDPVIYKRHSHISFKDDLQEFII